MKRLLFYITLCGIGPLMAQNTLNVPVLSEVVLTASRKALSKAGHIRKELTDTLLPGSFTGSLTQMVESSHSTHVRSFGPGLSSTYSSRGSSSSQVGVFWSDIPLNSPGLGSTDLSLIPTNLFNGSLTNGGNSSIYGNQAMGSVLNLKNNIQSGRRPRILLGTSYASFDNFTGFGQLDFSHRGFMSNTVIKYQKGKNNFSYPYRDETLSRKNAEAEILNVSQWLRWSNPQHKLNITGGVWYVNAKRQTPNSVLISKPGQAELFDQQWKSFISFKKEFRKGILKITQGYIVENQQYVDPSVGLDDYNDSKSSITRAIYEQGLNKHWKFVAGGDFIWSQVQGSSKETADQSNVGFFGSVHFKNKRNNLNLSLRQEFVDGQFIPLSPAFSFEHKIYPRFSWVGNVGFNFRYPSLNDRYWVPGGNPDLSPESGWSGETGLNWTNGVFEMRVVYFDGLLNNFIQWIPGQGGIWSPKNVKQVRSNGVENYAKLKFKQGYQKFYFHLGYTYTQAIVQSSEIPNDQSVGKQLIYTPEHKWSFNMNYGYKRWNLVYLFTHTGNVQANADHSLVGYMVPFALHNAEINYTFNIKRSQVKCHVAIKNFTNTTYETIKFYPMPGINFELGLTIKI